jgi:hypothetical protein
VQGRLDCEQGRPRELRRLAEVSAGLVKLIPQANA